MSNHTIKSTQPSAQTQNPNASTSLHMPESIVLEKWADEGFEWTGAVLPSSFERLAVLLTTEKTQQKLQIKINLYRHNNVLHLAFKVAGEVWLTCQRCLQPVATNLTDDYNIALLDDESQMGLVDEEQDYLLLDEVVIDQIPERLLPIKKLIEDEILLKLPLAPKHDDCEMMLDQVGEIPEQEEDNPFAVLAELKGKLSK